MTYFVRRTWSWVDPSENDGNRSWIGPLSGTLERYQDYPALVLLGAPGAGKTTCLRQEAENGRGHYVTARDFIALDPKQHPEWRRGLLLIDGLDEIRAGEQDGRGPLDKIRANLESLGCPNFRLSCRETAWLGASDWNAFLRMKGYQGVGVIRLDPLFKTDMAHILRTRTSVSDPTTFIERAEKEGFVTFLENPQNLEVLANAVGDGTWPNSRTEAFDQACRAVLDEKNFEHRAAKQNSKYTTDDLLDRAGEMCALQLLSGFVGWAVDSACSNEDFPVLARLQVKDIEGYRWILDTKLFDSADSTKDTGWFTTHRQIAEYLGARFLEKRLKEGLPLERVLALMTRDDGMVVAPLQGLAAWVAALCMEAREEIIDRNPLGTILDGDLSTFSVEEEIALLRRLRKEAKRNPWFWSGETLNSRLGDLVSKDGLAQEIRRDFEAAADSNEDRGFALFLAEALQYGKPIPAMLDFLLSGLRDTTWDLQVKKSSLWVLIYHWGVDSEGRKKLVDLLHDLNSKAILDPEDSLTGQLLKELYPDVIGFPEVLDYLRPRRGENLTDSYYWFWVNNFVNIIDVLSFDQRCEFLDIFAERVTAGQQNRPQTLDAFEREVFLAFLAKHLHASGDEIKEERRIFTWLNVVEWGPGNIFGMKNSELREIRQWLHSRPDLRKTLLELGLERHAGIEDLDRLEKKMSRMENFLFGNDMPADFGTWCLKRAEEAKDPLIVRYFARQVAWSIYYKVGSQGLSPEGVKEKLKARPEALKTYQDFSAKLALHWRRERKLEWNHMWEVSEKYRKRRLALKKHEDKLQNNQASFGLLQHLATAYFGGYTDIPGSTPHERLREFADHDKSLIQAILSGLRGCIDRDDLPTAKEVIRLAARKLRHQLVWPFMAGMEELARKASDGDFLPDVEQARLALTVHYAGIVPYFAESKAPPYPPSWYDAVFREYPDHAKESLIKAARGLMRAGHTMQRTFDLLVNTPSHQKMARIALPVLLKSFPPRCSQIQLDDLSILLDGGLKYCKKNVLLGLVESKLALSSMTMAQRIYWLGMGILLKPRSYLKAVENYVGKKEKRLSYLLHVIELDESRLKFGKESSIEIFSLLIRLGGRVYQPWAGLHRNDPPWSATPVFSSSMVATWIDQLASIPSKRATKEFEILEDDDHLRLWLPVIRDAAYRQKALFANTQFRHGSPSEVLATLRDYKPANLTDFKALLADRIADLARKIRDSDTNDWEQYWEGGKPRHEDLCRDAFLSDLREKLKRLDIVSELESVHSGRKRSDIEFKYGQEMAIPVEVKKSNSHDLWNGIRDQLIPRYTRKPETGGHGIYLVFWFGEGYGKPNPKGEVPRDTRELRQMLVADLREDEKRKISICVIDVSLQREKKGRGTAVSEAETRSA